MLTSLDNIETLHIKIAVSTLNWIIKNSIVFSNLKNFDYHVIKQEVGKFVFKINVTPNRLREYMSFNMNNELIFIDKFLFLPFSSDSSVKNLSKDDFRHLSQWFDTNVLDLVKQKTFYTFEYILLNIFWKVQTRISKQRKVS